MKRAGLTDRQRLFAHEYLIDLNGKQAAIRSGCPPKNAEVTASKWLRFAKVSALVEELKGRRLKKVDLSAEYVIGGIKEVAERCMQKARVMEWDREEKCLVPKTDENGEGVWEFDSGGANRALENLGRHLGLFTDRTDVQLHVPEPITFVPAARK